MGFIRKPPAIDLGDTAIENIFIDVYLPMANGTYVKVYLLAYKYSLDPDLNQEVTHGTIAKNLNIPLSDVLAAWDYWESKQIIKKHFAGGEEENNYTVEFLSLKQLLIDHQYGLPAAGKEAAVNASPSVNLSAQDVIEANQVPLIRQMFTEINQIMNRPLVPNEKRTVLEWFHQYNVDPPLVVRAFSYCKHKKKIKNINYVGGVIRNWYDQQITTVDQLQEYLNRQGERYGLYVRVFRALGFSSREPAESDIKIMDQWADEYQFPLEIILKACESASKTPNPNLHYIHGILSNWHEKGIKTLTDIQQLDQPVRKAPAAASGKPPAAPKTKFHLSESRFEQYSADELEELILKKQQKKSKQ